MNDSFDRERLSELMALLCEELIDDAQFDELEAILSNSAEARQWYHVYLGMHRDLETYELNSPSPRHDEKWVVEIAKEGRVPNRRKYASRWGIAIAGCLLMAIAGYSLILLLLGGQQAAPAVAFVTKVVDAEWQPGTSPLKLNDPIVPGRLRLKKGTVGLTLEHGVILSLVGPADLEIDADLRVFLHHGELAAYVPDGQEGFHVDTPGADIVDLGTEFGIRVDDSKSTQLSVFDGRVEIRPHRTDGRAEVVSAGHALQVSRTGVAQEFDLESFQAARGSLRIGQVVDEPFLEENFPGSTQGGWIGPWLLWATNGKLLPTVSGVLDDAPLHPGEKSYLGLKGESDSMRHDMHLHAQRTFGSIDQFSLAKPYTIELLLRIDSDPKDLIGFRLFSRPTSDQEGEASWELSAKRSPDDTGVAWKLPLPYGVDRPTDSLPIEQGKSYRCFIEVEPEEKVWRAVIADKTLTISNEAGEVIPLQGDTAEKMVLGLESISAPGAAIQFSIDGIRIQNRPGVSRR